MIRIGEGTGVCLIATLTNPNWDEPGRTERRLDLVRRLLAACVVRRPERLVTTNGFASAHAVRYERPETGTSDARLDCSQLPLAFLGCARAIATSSGRAQEKD